MIDNVFIRLGYRVNHSFLDLFYSILKFHNETINIWTHIFGFTIFLAISIYSISNFDPIYYEYMRYVYDLKKIDWKMYEGASCYDEVIQFIYEIEHGQKYSLFQEMSDYWLKYSVVFDNPDQGLKVHALGQKFPRYFDETIIMDQESKNMFSIFFEQVILS